MADIDIELTLQGGQVSDGWRRYEPGSTVRGWIRLTPREHVNCDRVLARLEWHTEGRGDLDRHRAAEIVLAGGDLTANTSAIRDFNISVPRDPWSYAGHYINIIWEVIVVVCIPYALDVIQKEAIVVAPTRPS
jgi:hypothetical protein